VKLFNRIFKYWRSDLLAGLSVSFVELPLAMGIALATNYPLQAGIIAAIVGGLLGWIIGGTHVGIKGPGAGSIVALVMALQAFNAFDNPLGVVLTCTLFAGLFLMVTGLMRFGRFAQLIPAGAITGLLAGIGFIIILKQADEFFGYQSLAVESFEVLKELPAKVMGANPIAFIIGAISLLILFIHPKIPSKTIHFIPGVIWVLLISVLLVWVFGLDKDKTIDIFGMQAQTGKDLLIHIDRNVFAKVNHPSFTYLNAPVFWVQCFSIFIILLVENLLSAKALDKIDPLSRKTNLNKDLSSSGLVTMVSSLIGGMPSITVISRSSVNVAVGGKSRLSNFTHGFMLLVFLLFAIPLINLLPKASLAAILVVTGYKLCSVRTFKNCFNKGWEQLAIFSITFYATLRYGLIIGIFAGLILDFLLSFFLSDFKIGKYWSLSRRPYIKATQSEKGEHVYLKGVFNFLTLLKLGKVLKKIPEEKQVVIDMADTQIVDRTIMEYVHDYADMYEKNGGYVEVVGLENHHSSSPHPAALHILNTTWKKNAFHSQRGLSLKRLSLRQEFSFKPEINYHTGHFQTFTFYKTRPPEYKVNSIVSNFETGTAFEVCDLHFHEGELTAHESVKTTIIYFKTPPQTTRFSIEHQSFYDKIVDFALKSKMQIPIKTKTDTLHVMANDLEAMEDILSPALIAYLEESETFYIECNRMEILIFKTFKLATPDEILELIEFASGIEKIMYDAVMEEVTSP